MLSKVDSPNSEEEIAEVKSLSYRSVLSCLSYLSGRTRPYIRNTVTICSRLQENTEGALIVHQCQNWFAKFRSGNFDVEDAPRSGRPVEADKDVIKALVDANRRITTREIGLRLNLSNSTVYAHLKGLRLPSKLDAWVPHVLAEKNLYRHIDVCDSLLKRHENDPVLKRIITEDETGHGAKKMYRLKPFPKPIFTKKWRCCLFGGILKESFF
ncbi:histone-lysine N-methyltransferase SETMAR [Trichonephila clavipes]|nr:histone-lysine N-methyltransferase SETMAR [Trichonephila clavipes]